MGRFYFGTISGKFWASCQMSNDASNFKNNNKNPIRCDEYIGCGCIVEYNNQLYCSHCYNCIEEHISLLDLDDYDYDYDKSKSKSLIKKSNIYKYYFDKNELDYIQETLKKLENKIGHENIKNLYIVIFDENTDNTCYKYEINNNYLKNIPDDLLYLVARWCLGKLIECSIINLYYCEMFCE
jgi:hypothetical protein